jgi:hypothetical protein
MKGRKAETSKASFTLDFDMKTLWRTRISPN